MRFQFDTRLHAVAIVPRREGDDNPRQWEVITDYGRRRTSRHTMMQRLGIRDAREALMQLAAMRSGHIVGSVE